MGKTLLGDFTARESFLFWK